MDIPAFTPARFPASYQVVMGTPEEEPGTHVGRQNTYHVWVLYPRVA